MQVNFWTHACAELVCGRKRLVTDPWCIGPAFMGGWLLKHQPPKDWLDRLASADAIYISHTHSDHMNPTTLRALAKENRNAPIYIPKFDSGSTEKAIAPYGFTNVHVVPLGAWVDLGESVSFQMLPDTSGRDDSGLVVRHGQETLVDVVDAPNLNAGVLPCGIDWLLAPFASGGSSYPLCYLEQYEESVVKERLGKLRDVALKSLIRLVNITEPKNLLPFAGYYLEADPALTALNGKNSPESIKSSFRWTHPDLEVHLPRSQRQEHREYGPPYPSVDVNLAEYFDWAGWKGDLLLCIEEMDQNLRRTIDRHFVDFSKGTVTKGEPVSPGRYLNMKVRRQEFRYALAHGLGWEELATGFHCRFWRNPDAYEVDFWDHFQNHLPKEALCPTSS